MNQSSASAAAVKPLNILIVDDSATMRALLHRVVGLADLPIGTIYQAPNGLEALKILETHSVQAVFTDLNMPVMNGMQMIKALRALPAFMGVPIVFLTTESDDAVKQEAKAAGATGWITKPFKPEQLLAVVAKLVRS